MSERVQWVEDSLVLLLSNVGDRGFDIHFNPRLGAGPTWEVYIRPTMSESGARRCVASGTGQTLVAAIESVLARLEA